MLVNHIVIFNEMFTNIKVIALRLHLGIGYTLGNQAMLNRGVLIHSGPLHKALDALTAETAKGLILQRGIKTRAARVSLSSCPPPKLIINASSFMMLGADDMKSTGLDYLLMFLKPFFMATPLRIATENDIHAAPSHVRSHRDRSQMPSLGNNARLALMILSIQHLMRYTRSREKVAQIL